MKFGVFMHGHPAAGLLLQLEAPGMIRASTCLNSAAAWRPLVRSDQQGFIQHKELVPSLPAGLPLC